MWKYNWFLYIDLIFYNRANLFALVKLLYISLEVLYTRSCPLHIASFISSFPNCLSVISFSCLISLVKMSSTLLNRSGEIRHPCLVLDLSGEKKLFVFLIKYETVCFLWSGSVSHSVGTPWTSSQFSTPVCQSPLSMGFSSKNTGVGCHSLFQGIFPIQGSNSHLLHCRQIL